nr:hypothetical protein K-LCC10_0209 [Kaumoebavirus]
MANNIYRSGTGLPPIISKPQRQPPQLLVPPIAIPKARPADLFGKKSTDPQSISSSYSETPRSDSERSFSSSSYYERPESPLDYSQSDSGREKVRDSREGKVEFGVRQKHGKLRIKLDGIELLEKSFVPPGKIFNATGKDILVRFSHFIDGIETKVVAKIPAEWGEKYTCKVRQTNQQGFIHTSNEYREGDEPCRTFVLHHQHKRAAPYHIYNMMCDDGIVRPYDFIAKKYVEISQDQIPGRNSNLDRFTAYPIFPPTQESSHIIILVNKTTAAALTGQTVFNRIITDVGQEKIDGEMVYDVELDVGIFWSAVTYMAEPEKKAPLNAAELVRSITGKDVGPTPRFP